MSVVEVKLHFSGLSGKDELALGRRDYEQEWLVRTDNAADGAKTVKSHPSVPQYGTFYRTDTENDPFAYLREREIEPASEDSSLVWRVRCRFSTVADNGNGQQILPPPQPFDVPIIAEWDALEEKEPAYFCFGDNEEQLPIVNSAGDFFDPPPERIITIQVLRITQNLADFNYLFWAKYSNAINSDTWNGFAPGMVLFKPPKARFIAQRGIGYWETNFEFHINYRGWFAFRWDAGVREFIDSDADPSGLKRGYNHMKNTDGSYVTEPVLLNGQGRRLVPLGKEGNREIIDNIFKGIGPVLFKFRVQPKLPFGPLGII